MGLDGPYGKGEKGLKGWPRATPWAGPNWTIRGSHPTLSFSLSLSFLLLLLGLGKGETYSY